MSETSGFATVEGAENASQEQNIETPVDNGGEAENSQESGDGGHPAWEEILSGAEVPEAYKPLLRKTFQQWDEGVNKKFEELHQVQSQFEPYKPFIENNVEPQQLERAYQIMQMIEKNPEGFYQQMGDFYKFNQGQTAQASGQGQQVDDVDEYDISGEEETPDPRYQQLEQQQQLIAQALVQMHQKEENAAADRQLEAELAQLREERGEFDENFVLNVAANTNGDLKGAVDKYFEIVASVQGKPRPGSNFPKVVSPSSGTPQTPVNPAELDSRGTKDLALQVLQRMNTQE